MSMDDQTLHGNNTITPGTEASSDFAGDATVKADAGRSTVMKPDDDEPTLYPDRGESTVRIDLNGSAEGGQADEPAVEPDLEGKTIRASMDEAMDKTATPDLPVEPVASDVTNNLAHQEMNESTDTRKSFMVRGERYVKETCLSDNSGEAQVYLVSKDGKKSVLKIYYPNYKAKSSLLKIISSIHFEMIVNLYDFGKMYIDGVYRDYELMEYLSGGTLTNYNVGGDLNRFRRIALQTAAALEYCHNCNVIHKDIKPGNFFFRDEAKTQVVLGDFGISSVIKNGEMLHRTTQARTPVYASPEMYTDVIDGVVEITPATDFYSLGITLLAIWNGQSPFRAGERTIMKRKNEGRLPGIENLPERVGMLIKGLTAVNPSKRWTYEQVEEWFKGGSPAVDIASPFLKYNTFVFDADRNLVADTAEDLVPLMLDNQRIARGYLYDGKFAQWFESCGNMKISSELKDICENRYADNKEAGLMAAVYAIDPRYPFVDMKGEKLNNIHEVAMSLVLHADQYAALLRNPYDRLWIYIEGHTNCNVDRMKTYFRGSPDRNTILRTAYEIDKSLPFIIGHETRTIKDIVRCFGEDELNEDTWMSVTDGRLLSWMYCHEDKMACEALRIMTDGQEYSRQLAYKVLYNIDREAAYDLRGADTPVKVGRIMARQLEDWEHLDEAAFREQLSEYSDPDGRFQYFAQLHGWINELDAARRCFDMKSDENRQRFGLCDLRTAAYRFCMILGGKPEYVLSSGVHLQLGDKLSRKLVPQLRDEMRSGTFAQWLSLAYHENPYAEFTETYAYEKTLERWIMALGEIDAHEKHYVRFVKAQEETKNKYETIRREFERSRNKEIGWRALFWVLAVVWLGLVVFTGLGSDHDYILNRGFVTVCLPVGGMTAMVMAIRSYFQGYGPTLSLMWGVGGFLTSYIPLWTLRWVVNAHPSMFMPSVLLLSLVYISICKITAPRSDNKEVKTLLDQITGDNVKATLIEPLYYTFKTNTNRYKGSSFSVLDDVYTQSSSTASETVVHYVIWSLMLAALIAGAFLLGIV